MITMKHTVIGLKIAIIFTCLFFSYLVYNGPLWHDQSWQTNNTILIFSTDILALIFYVAFMCSMILLQPIQFLLGKNADRVFCNVQSVPCLIPLPYITIALFFLTTTSTLFFILYVYNVGAQRKR